MAVRISNFPKKSFDQPQFTISCSSWWNLNDLQVPESFSNNITFKAESSPSPHIDHEPKHLGLQLLDQAPSSIHSIGQSHDNAGADGGTNPQDQCYSSKSGDDDSQEKSAEGKMKPTFLLGPPNYSHPMSRLPYSYGKTYFGGLLSAYGPQSTIVPAVMGMTGGRIPLPLDLTNDGPIYVNAKQYNGILRRRQSRAKLEARNRLLKARKPYLHESRHLHALNRVRGSGGRFLSTKNLRQSNLSSADIKHGRQASFHMRQKNLSLDLESDIITGEAFASDNGAFRQPDHHFSGMSTKVGVTVESNERFIHGRNQQHCISAIR